MVRKLRPRHLRCGFKAGTPNNSHYSHTYFIDGMDHEEDCCFFLSRSFGEDQIDIMIEDQDCWKVDDLLVELRGNRMIAQAEEKMPPNKGGRRETYLRTFIIDIEFEEDEREEFLYVLRLIFAGKKGLTIIDEPYDDDDPKSELTGMSTTSNEDATLLPLFAYNPSTPTGSND